MQRNVKQSKKVEIRPLEKSMIFRSCKSSFGMKRTKGLNYLLELIRHPFQSIRAIDLNYLDTLSEAGKILHISDIQRQNRDISLSRLFCLIPMTDEKTIREIKQRLHYLDTELETRRVNNDLSGVEELMDEKEGILKYLSEVLSCMQKIRNFGDGEESLVRAIHRAIKRALLQLSEHDPDLANALKQDLHLWRTLCYTPAETQCKIIC